MQDRVRTRERRTFPGGDTVACSRQSVRSDAVEQSGLTVITAIRPGRLAALRRSLTTIGATIPFQNMSTVHYAAFLVLPCLDDCPPRLAGCGKNGGRGEISL